METPDEWPFEIQESYDPIRILGTGGFASVVLARHKNSNNATGTGTATATASANDTDIDTGIQKNKVAIKIVGCIHKDGNGNSNGIHLTDSHLKQQRDRAVLYARREIEILKHVHHPNIVRLFHHWIRDENDNDNENENHGRSENKKAPSRTQTQSLTAAVLVLEYARGPTVESLLKHGGALSTNFGRIVIAQTMNAIAYLHCHAVLHRDIKPDNILVAGALSSDDFVWDNEKDTEDKLSDIGIDGGRRHNHPAPNWEALRSKYKVTLIDFGFARALTPNDISKPSIETKRTDSELASYHRISNDRAYKGGVENDELGSSHHSTKSSHLRNRILKGVLDSSFHRLVNRSNHKNTPTTRDELSNSLSHKLKRTMSALGNLNFAAPEIVHKVRPRFRPRTELPIKRPEQTPRGQTSTTETISNYVADYGLLVDSYSMGHTIRYMMTGVRPGISIEDAIWQQQRGVWVKKLCSLCRGRRNSAKRKQERSVRIRSMEDLPGDIYRLVGALTQLAEEHRISIRKARWNVPWIADVLESQEQEQEPCPPTAPPLASQSQSGQSQSQSLTQTPRIKRENDEQKEETALSQAPEEDPFRSNFYHISYLPFASIPPSKKPVARESESNVTKATTALIEHDGWSADDDVSPVDSTESETTLTF